MEFTLEELSTDKKRRQYIMNDIEKKLQWLEDNTDHNIIYIALQGSQTYEMDIYTEEYMSDIDVKAICIPSLDDVVRGKKMVSHTYVMKDNSHIDVKDIRLYIDLWKKSNPQFLEILFTEFYICRNEKFKHILEMADRIAFANKDRLLSCIKGMQMEKYKALKHPYPTIKDKIDKYGYDCYSDDTKFLTKNGWKTYYEIEDGEEIGTFNQTTKELEFQKFYDRFCKHYDGEMYDVETINTHFCVTPNHNVYTSSVIDINKNGHKYINDLADWKLEKIEDIMNTTYSKNHSSKHRHLAVVYNGNDDLLEYDGVEITDDLLKIIGAYVSEGTTVFRNGKVKEIRISQMYKDFRTQIKFIEMMKSVQSIPMRYYKHKRKEKEHEELVWSINDQIKDYIYKWCGHLSKNKKLPDFIYYLSKRQAKIMLDSLILGDGTLGKSRYVYYTSSYKLANDVHILAMLCEKYSVLMGGEDGYISNDHFSNGELRMYQVSIKREEYSPNWCYFKLGKNVKEINYNGNVVCFSVPNSILITQKDGKIAIQGNSKQAHHIYRLLVFATDIYVGEKSFRESLVPEGEHKNICLDYKQNIYPVDEIELDCQEMLWCVKMIAEKYRTEHEPVVDTECYEILENIVYDIILDEIKEKIREE